METPPTKYTSILIFFKKLLYPKDAINIRFIEQIELKSPIEKLGENPPESAFTRNTETCSFSSFWNCWLLLFQKYVKHVYIFEASGKCFVVLQSYAFLFFLWECYNVIAAGLCN